MACEYCGGEIPPKRAAQHQKILTCSPMCSQNREASLRMATAASRLGLNKTAVGPLAEMMVAVDLMRRGYYVFRAVGPNCPCDLIVLHNDQHLSIEVRTAYKGRKGTIQANREKKADIWAGVLIYENEIVYEPPLETFFGESPPPDMTRSAESAVQTKERRPRRVKPTAQERDKRDLKMKEDSQIWP